MEKRKSSELLEEVCVEPKLSQRENLCDEMLKEAKSDLLCNLNEKRASDAYSGYSEERNGEFGRELDNGNAENNNVALEGYGNQTKDSDVPVWEGNFRFSRNGVQFGKGEEPMKQKDEFLRVQKVGRGDIADERCNNVFHPHDPGSPTKIEVSGNSINLFVEVFGPLDGMSESNSSLNGGGVNVLGDSDSKLVYSTKESGTVSYDVKSANVKNEQECSDEEQEYMFDLGDFVWVKMRTQLWWPGVILDPSCSTVNAAKSQKKGYFLVKYFGNAKSVWCKNSNLKPFIECFEQISQLNSSRSFSVAIEKALCEVGKHVKSKMTCGCFSKDSERNKERSLMSLEKEKCKSDVRLLSQFNPASFFEHIRHLAYSGNAPSKFEFTLMKNRLSAFYCSIGHYELPLQQLGDATQKAQDGPKLGFMSKDNNKMSGRGSNAQTTCDGTVKELRRGKRKRSLVGAVQILDDKIISSGKGSKSRERKKSKYLSYPYVDAKQGHNVTTTVKQEPDDDAHPSSLPSQTAPQNSCSGSSHLTSRNKWSKKHSSGCHIVSAADNIDACSAELLSELCATAQDCFYISRSKYSDLLKKFYSSFRIVSFLDADTASKLYGCHEEPEREKCILQNSPKAGVVKEPKKKGVVKESKKKEVVKESKKKCVNLASVEATVDNGADNQISETNNLQPKGNAVRKAAKKKEQVTTPGLQSTDNCSVPGIETNPNSSRLINFQQTCSGSPNFSTPANREGDNPVLPKININAQLPDLNGNHPSFPDEQMPLEVPPPTLGNPLPELRTEGLVTSININGIDKMISPSVPTLNGRSARRQNIPQFSNGVNATNCCWNVEFAGSQMEPHAINTGFMSFAQSSAQAGLFPPANSKRKERKRKEKICQVASSVIPDLNGTVLDTSSMGKTLPDGNQIPTEGIPERKKRRNKSANAESGSDGKINVEDLGGSVLLNFAAGFTLPSKEMLVAKFSRFGLLKESELQVLDDSTVQIVYERSSDARFAFRSVEKSNPFGESLTGVKLHGTADVSRTKPRKNNMQQMVQPFSPADMCRTPAKFGGTPGTCKNKFQVIQPLMPPDTCNNPANLKETPDAYKNKFQLVQPFVPPDACKNPAKAAETPDIVLIRQNVEMMKLTLEKAGSNLPSEMRLKLENEIKTFLDKISSVGGSSSS